MFLACASFCFVASITPGPNNMMLLSSGATFGLRRTLPHILGISVGCAAMVLLLGWGMSGVAEHLPQLYSVLHIASTAYLLWLAWKIATSAGPLAAEGSTRPLTALQAAAFQWVNPKAWAMVLGAISNFARPDQMLLDVFLIAGILLLVGVPSITVWAGGGSMLQGILHKPRSLQLFNWTMAAVLVLSILPGWWEVLTGQALPSLG